MRAWLVFEESSSPTKAIARAIAGGLSDAVSVDLHSTATAPREIGSGVGLLLVGAAPVPTSPRASTNGGTALPSPLLRWIQDVRLDVGSVLAAAFDVRVQHPRHFVPPPAQCAHDALVARQVRMLMPPEGFSVHRSDGALSLVDGEEIRARHWGEALARVVGAAPVPPSDPGWASGR